MAGALRQAGEGGQELVCPTCGAGQPWSEQCRRCKSDLRDLSVAWDNVQRARLESLKAIKLGEFDRALGWARRYAELYPCTGATRLVVVCNLLCGNWLSALRIGQRTSTE